MLVLQKATSMQYYLAQVNIAKMLAPIDSPLMADFVANLDRINALAESSDGFIWRLKTEGNNATDIKVYDDDFIIVNMSVWRDIDSLFAFTYHSSHTEIFKRRREWFEKMSDMYMCLWYVEENKMPTPQDAVDKLDYLRKHGETPHAFTFKKRFTAADFINL